MKVRNVIKRLKADGWTVVCTRGSHRQLKHPTKPGTVTVAGHLSVCWLNGLTGSAESSSRLCNARRSRRRTMLLNEPYGLLS